MEKLAGKVAIVTGSGQGLGKAYATVFAKEGACVAIVDLNGDNAAQTAAEIKENGGRAIAVAADVSNQEQVNEAVKQTVEAFGTVDILVNNAQGLARSKPLIEVTTSDMEITWRTGPLGTLYFMQACYPYMKENGGRVINVCSDTGIEGFTGFTAYGSAKEAIRAITRVAAREWGKDNITVNVVSPGAMTPAAKAFMEAEPEKYAAIMAPVPMGRLGDPVEDIAPGLVFLASEDGKFITGQTIELNGGHTFVR
ncbi:SDR family NAD(P)-dependent oxidoreductase [Bacillus testis]|uniref:SDR family NAD(P)-dependent oxidoreductase n=1 Tax=Bacillus testis TaxID=1622072 RepID=UPI00067EE99A|nr:SDR family NAD(P)-dependent oxidoreductase [Bacillus testis]